MRHALLALTFVLPLSSAAQDPIDPLDFWPMEVGNVWEYESEDGYERWTVVAETTLNERPAFGLHIVRYDDTNPPPTEPGPANCVIATEVHTDPNRPGLDIYAQGSLCPTFKALGGGENYGTAYQHSSPGDSVEIGGVSYEIDALASGWDEFSGGGNWLASWNQALHIGIVHHGWSYCFQDACTGRGGVLGYAVVGGQVYGTWPLANEPSPDGTSETPTAFRVDRAFPNPFQEGVTVAFSLPAPEAVVLSLYDVRGRQVTVRDLGALPAGSHRAVVDGTDLAPGLYLTRLTTGSGKQASHRVLRAD